MHKISVFVLLVVLLSLFVGCTPTEEVAVLEPTPLPPTATPVPTPEPTPVPYDVTLAVSDGEGFPLPGAQVIIGSQTLTLDESGQLTLSDLPGESFTLQVNMPGYFPLEHSTTLVRGDNQVDLVLERDPEGLLVEHACGPGETLLYIADFQDGKGHGWDLVEIGQPGWRVAANPEAAEDLVLEATEGAGFANLTDPNVQGLENVVWRFRFRYDGSGNSHINFRFAPEDGDRRYIVVLGDGQARLDRLLGSHVSIAEAGQFTKEQWHLLEVAFYDGTVTVYIDGQAGATWTDPNPWPGGSLSLEPYPMLNATFYYDDMSVCGLSAPFVTIPRPATGVNLAVNVVDEAGMPLPQVSGLVPEMGSYAGAMQVSDAAGLLAWSDLPAGPVTVALSAPGYEVLEERLVLDMGDNEQTFTLIRDPNGLTLKHACLPGETMLYIEDFQDGLAQDWRGIDLGIEGWSVTGDPDNAADLVIAATQGAPWADMTKVPAGGFNDVIWRYWFRFDGPGRAHNNFRFAPEGGDTRYIVNIFNNQISLDRLADNNHVTVRNAGYAAGRSWHLLEVAYYADEVIVFLDGVQTAVYPEPNPWVGGNVNLEPYPDSGSVFYYNNISICELTEPPQSITSLAVED